MTDAATQLRRLFDLSPDLLIVADRDLFVCRVNPSWERVLGHPPASLVGRSLIERGSRSAHQLDAGGAAPSSGHDAWPVPPGDSVARASTAAQAGAASPSRPAHVRHRS